MYIFVFNVKFKILAIKLYIFYIFNIHKIFLKLDVIYRLINKPIFYVKFYRFYCTFSKKGPKRRLKARGPTLKLNESSSENDVANVYIFRLALLSVIWPTWFHYSIFPQVMLLFFLWGGGEEVLIFFIMHYSILLFYYLFYII